jgi:hypothetical protein
MSGDNGVRQDAGKEDAKNPQLHLSKGNKHLPAAPIAAKPRPVDLSQIGKNPPVRKEKGNVLRYGDFGKPMGQGRIGYDPGGYLRSVNNGADQKRVKSQIKQQKEKFRKASRENIRLTKRRAKFDYHNWDSSQRWRPQASWGIIGHFDGYCYNNDTVTTSFFAAGDWCPTAYTFLVDSGEFWQAGNGYFDYLPADYAGPITVAVWEYLPIPELDDNGDPVVDDDGNPVYVQQVADDGNPEFDPDTGDPIYETEAQLFFYNAFWDDDAGSYEYLDYQGDEQFVTFPWLTSW